MSYLAKARELYDMIGQGKVNEALDKFYHDDVVVIEGDGSQRNSKEEQRKAMEEWEQSIEEMHGGGVYSITANEDTQTTIVESWVDVKHKGMDRWKMEEVAVQQWEGDQIVKERFYYFVPAAMQQAMQP